MKKISKSAKVDKIITTKYYDKAYKKLKKNYRNDVIKDIDVIVNDLKNLNIHKQKFNHSLSLMNVNEMHVRGDVLLLYRYTEDMLPMSLVLVDITNHKILRNSSYNKKINKILRDLGLEKDILNN